MSDNLTLFGGPFVACVMMTGMLGYLGMHVLKREVIFIDIASAQLAALGAIVAHLVFKTAHDSVLAYGCAIGATMLAAIFFAFTRRRIREIPLEAVIGVTYAIAAGATLLIIGIAPGGHGHVRDILTGSILWVTWPQLGLCLGVFIAIGLCFLVCRKPFTAISENYDEACKTGYRTVLWDIVFYALFGVVITFSVRIAGVLVVFAFLIIPATISALLTTRTSLRLLITWGAGTMASLAGLAFSNYYDFSVGPSVAFFLGLFLVGISILAWLIKKTNAVCHPSAQAQNMVDFSREV